MNARARVIEAAEVSRFLKKKNGSENVFLSTKSTKKKKRRKKKEELQYEDETG